MKTRFNPLTLIAGALFAAGLLFSRATLAYAEELPSTLAKPINTIVTYDESQSLANQFARASQYYSTLSFAGTYRGAARHYTGSSVGISMNAS